MKKTVALVAIAATSGLAHAGVDTLTIDVSGWSSWGFQGDPQNEILSVLVGAGTQITNIAWDLNLTTVGASWAEENTMTFENQLSINPGAGDAFTVFNQNYTGSTPSFLTTGADGILDIEFHEVGFDDIPGGIDSFFESGSTITLTCGNCIPTPGSLPALALGGLIVSHRHRKTQ